MKKQITYSTNEEMHLLLGLSIAGFVIAIVSLLINFQLSLSYYLELIVYAGIVIYGIMSIAIYKGLNKLLSQYILVYITLIFTNLLWFYEGGEDGPILYFFIILFTLIIFIWNNNYLLIGSLILLINLLILFFIDYYYPDFVPGYNDAHTKTIDIYSSIIMFSIVIYILMNAVKKSYAREYKRALQSDKLKTSFLENISHEIRTPLNAIIGFSELLISEDLTKEEKAEYGELINDCNENLLQVIDDILQVSLLETEQLDLKIEDCNLNQVFEELLITYSIRLAKIEKTKIHLNISDSESNIIVKTDIKKLRQIMVNLLDNAVKFTHSGDINFGYKVIKTNILFHITDTGIGIKKMHQNEIFNRFYKIDDNKDELFRGTGIGLFLTKKIIESFGGKIWVESNFGKGSTFYFTIPK